MYSTVKVIQIEETILTFGLLKMWMIFRGFVVTDYRVIPILLISN